MLWSHDDTKDRSGQGCAKKEQAFVRAMHHEYTIALSYGCNIRINTCTTRRLHASQDTGLQK